jgi:pilus assembly protein Flp/PilA
VELATVWQRLSTFVRARARSERGASLVEYALLVGLIALVCIIAIAFVGTSASTGIHNDGSSMFINP